MKRNVRVIAIVAAVFFGLVGWTGYGQRTKQPAPQAVWEYKVVFIPCASSMSEQALNGLGAQGWELRPPTSPSIKRA